MAGIGVQFVFLLMVASSAAALLIAAPLVLANWLMPLRLVYVSSIESRFRPDARARFSLRQKRNAAAWFRYWLGMLFFPVPIVAFLALILVEAIVVVSLSAMGTPVSDQTTYFVGELFGGFLVAWFLIGVALIPLSYIYEFYVLHPNPRLRSWNFFVIFLFNLAFPIFFWMVFLILMQSGAINLSEQKIFHAAAAPLVVADEASTPCNAMLGRIGLRLSSIENKGAEAGYPPLWVDRYLRSITFDTLEPFGCSFTDVRSNPANTTMSMLMVIYRLGVSIFSISVYVLLVQRLMAKMTRQKKPAAA